VHDTSEDRQAADEAWHPQHGGRGHHELGTTSQRAEPKS